MVPPPLDDGLPILRDYVWREFSMVLYGIVAVTFVFGLAALIEYCSARRNRVCVETTQRTISQQHHTGCPQGKLMSVPDLARLVEVHLVPNLVPLLVALLVLLASTVIALIVTRRADAARVVKKEKPAFRAYSRQEIAKHNTPDDCWVIIKLKHFEDRRVFDVTEFIEEHPGGDAIYRNAGGDATGGFYGPHHPPRAHDMIEEFMIGTVLDE